MNYPAADSLQCETRSLLTVAYLELPGINIQVSEPARLRSSVKNPEKETFHAPHLFCFHSEFWLLDSIPTLALFSETACVAEDSERSETSSSGLLNPERK